MCSGRSDWALPQPGFPIRISTDQSLVDSSPWLFAATHVLHRHLAPRHPPLALCNLKSHTPRLFSGEKSKEPLLSRRSCSLCSSQRLSRDANRLAAAVWLLRSRARRKQSPDLPLRERSEPRALWRRERPVAASSKQSSEHPVRWDLGGVCDGPAVLWTEVREQLAGAQRSRCIRRAE